MAAPAAVASRAHDAALDRIKTVVGPKGWTDDAAAMRPHLEDWRGLYKSKARMVVKLAVAGAFHTYFMAPAAEALTAGLKDTPISTPKIPVISNVNVEAHTDADSIRATLAKQVSLF